MDNVIVQSTPEVQEGMNSVNHSSAESDLMLDIPAKEAELAHLKQLKRPDLGRMERVADLLTDAYVSIGYVCKPCDLIQNSPHEPLSADEQEQFDKIFNSTLGV